MGAVRMRVNGCSAVNGCRQFFTGGRVIMDYELCGILVINVLMLDLFNLFWGFSRSVDILQTGFLGCQAGEIQAGRACTCISSVNCG